MDDKPALNVTNAGRLAYLAALAAIETPERQAKYSPNAQVRWSLIHEIRAELDAAGFNWRAALRDARAREKARAADAR
jgi:hypothetical protein